MHRKALFRVTPLVRGRLRVADESIAYMSNGGATVDAIRDGRTEVQVCDPAVLAVFCALVTETCYPPYPLLVCRNSRCL